MNVTVNGAAYSVSFGPACAANAAPAAAPAASASAPAAVTGGEAVKAPVAGTLLKQCLSNGASVTKGQTVIIIESMKMELEVKAPCDGTISYSVAAGTQVANGQTLAQIGKAAAPAAPAPAPKAAPAASAAPSPAPAAAPSGAGKIVKAPVAGVLLRTAVSEGASVGANDTIIIIESMKMELEIKAGASGKVHFLAGPGTQIANGQPVAEIG